MAILAITGLAGIVIFGWLALTKQAADARLPNEAGRRLKNAAPLGAALRREAESGLAFGGGDARGGRTLMSAPPNSATIGWQTNADARRCGEVIVSGEALVAPKATERNALPFVGTKITTPDKTERLTSPQAWVGEKLNCG